MLQSSCSIKWEACHNGVFFLTSIILMCDTWDAGDGSACCRLQHSSNQTLHPISHTKLKLKWIEDHDWGWFTQRKNNGDDLEMVYHWICHIMGYIPAYSRFATYTMFRVRSYVFWPAEHRISYKLIGQRDIGWKMISYCELDCLTFTTSLESVKGVTFMGLTAIL